MITFVKSIQYIQNFVSKTGLYSNHTKDNTLISFIGNFCYSTGGTPYMEQLSDIHLIFTAETPLPFLKGGGINLWLMAQKGS